MRLRSLPPLQDGHGMLGEAAAREGGTALMHALKHGELRRRHLAGAPACSLQDGARVLVLSLQEAHTHRR